MYNSLLFADVNTELFLACKNNDLKSVIELLADGANANYQDNYGDTALITICGNDKPNIDIIDSLIAAGANINIKANDGWTALMVAVDKNYTDISLKLINRGADVNFKDNYNVTALMRACGRGNIDIVNALIQAGADVNVKGNTDGSTALIQAIGGNAPTEVIKKLIKAGANINIKSDKFGTTPLMAACFMNNLSLIDILLEAGANVNIKNNAGETALTAICSISEGTPNKDILTKLIKAGADVNAEDKNGQSVLMFACIYHELDFINYIIQAGANINKQGAHGFTALMGACGREISSTEIVKTLIRLGADVNARASDGWTALMIASEKGYTEICLELIKAGANTSFIEMNTGLDESGIPITINAVSLAIDNNHMKTAKMLIDNGADGASILFNSALAGKIDICKKLIEAGVNVNAQVLGNTALQAAVEKNHYDIVKYLLMSGADANHIAPMGITALGKACAIGNIEIVKLLINSGADIYYVNETAGWSCIDLAEMMNHQDICDLLYQKVISDALDDLNFIPIPSKNIEIMRTEVTQRLYTVIMGKNPSSFKGLNLPVEGVNWYDAIMFCNTLSKEMDLTPSYIINGAEVKQDIAANGFRLPTELEWEYAAQGGEVLKYSGSNSIDEVAWYYNNSDNKPHPVAQKKPNGYGLYDMSGNVWEWCWETGPYYDGIRLIRGGGWEDNSMSCEVSGRNWTEYADIRNHKTGFRVVRTLQ